MPHRRDLNHEPVAIVLMLAQGPTTLDARCEGCRCRLSLTVEALFEMGFGLDNAVIDIGGKLRRSACGRNGALTEPDWTTAPKAEGAPRTFSCPNSD